MLLPSLKLFSVPARSFSSWRFPLPLQVSEISPFRLRSDFPFCIPHVRFFLNFTLPEMSHLSSFRFDALTPSDPLITPNYCSRPCLAHLFATCLPHPYAPHVSLHLPRPCSCLRPPDAQSSSATLSFLGENLIVSSVFFFLFAFKHTPFSSVVVMLRYLITSSPLAF